MKEKEKIEIKKELEEKSKTLQPEQIENIRNILQWKYPNILATTIPTKASVTQLKQLSQKRVTIQKSEITFAKPKFLKAQDEKLSNAQKGTLVHLCMQHLKENIQYDLEMIKELIQNLEQKEIITANEAENINPYPILQFTKSSTWKQLQQAKEIEREKAFYIQVPAKEIYGQDVEEWILVQGIIDLYYKDKNGKLVLVDYKTDYVEKGEEQELISKYKKQLQLYKYALEEAMNQKVEKTYLYSTYLGKELEVK